MTKTNTSCIVDNGRLITEFDNIEFTQTYPSRKNVKIYRDAQKEMMSNPNSINLMMLQSKLQNAKDEDVQELQIGIIDCEKELSKTFDPMESTNNLILASLEGTKYKKGSFKVDKKKESFEYNDFDELPEVVHMHLVNNVHKLITIQDDEEKN